MRYAVTIVLLLFTLMLGACSFSIDFAVINESGQPIEITYKIGGTSIEPLNEPGKPATLAASQLSSREWRELSSTQYVFDAERRAVTVSLTAGTALRINRGRAGDAHDTGDNFIIKEISIKGANGEINLQGNQVYQSFVVVPKPFYQFGPSALLTLTYK